MKKVKGSATLTILIVCLVLLIFIFLFEMTFNLSRSLEKYHSKQRLIIPKHTHESIIKCDRSHYEYDICNLNRSTMLDPTRTTLSAMDRPTNSIPPQFEKIRPYPRKWQTNVMSVIKELTLTTSPPNTSCGITHNITALVFSAGGYTGNFLHDFNDGFIPLFITVNSIFPNQEIIIVVINGQDWWLLKYAKLLQRFTRRPIINLDRETISHCFPSVTVGLISHGPMNVDPTLLHGPHPKSIMDFHALLASTYGQKQYADASSLSSKQFQARPQLVLVSRKNNRRILNEEKVGEMAEVVGFNVVFFEPKQETSLDEAFSLIASSHALMGVHGAALTHELFLRPSSVLVQVVPIGFDWMAETCFGKLANRLGLEYIEYNIGVEESRSLVDKYGRDSLEVNNPGAIVKGNWSNMGVYLTQNVNLDLVRLRTYLDKAYDKARRFMIRESLYIQS